MTLTRGKFANILETIGRTPVVKIRRLAPPNVSLYVKIEAFNPMGSVKDRLALGIIEDAERRGLLQPGQTVVEATSGNTGIGLAMVCAVKGYPLVVTMAENFSIERRKLMRFLGATVVLTPAALKGSGMLAKATELARAHGWFLCRQFENEANADMHSRTTAREILPRSTASGLTISLRDLAPGVLLRASRECCGKSARKHKIIVCEPDNSQLLGSGIAQPRNADRSPAGSHVNFRPHLMQGWSPDFIPKLTEDAVALKLFDRIVPVNGAQSLKLARELAQKEGIFVRYFAGATLAGALLVCEQATAGATVLCMLPDTGERYLSTPLFSDISVDMTRAGGVDFAIHARIIASMCRPPRRRHRPRTRQRSLTDAAEAFVTQAIADSTQPVVMFALEWCEFCWSVRRMFAKLGIAYRSIDLDSVEYQQGNRGAEIRAALAARTSRQYDSADFRRGPIHWRLHRPLRCAQRWSIGHAAYKAPRRVQSELAR